MQLSNYHSHSTFCDGRSEPETFIRFALSKGFRAYGFSSHAPLPFETFWSMSAADMPEYLCEIERLKQKYHDQLEIYVGLEIDYLDQTYNPAIPYFQTLPLDYSIGSVHYIPIAQELLEKNMVCIDGHFDEFKAGVDRYFGGDIRKLVKAFYESTLKMVETGGFDIVGHFDKIYMNGQRCPGFSMDADWYQKPLRECLELISSKGLMVEVNTKNRMRQNQTFPHIQHFKQLQEMNIPIMINSDAHFPDLINDGRFETSVLLKEIGYRTTRELIAGKWEDVALI